MKTIFACALLLGSSLALANYPDGTKWLVSDKHCGTTTMQVLPGEKIQFADGFFVKSAMTSETATQQCFQGLIYTRVLQSHEGDQGSYHEEASLTPNARKAQCIDKASGAAVTNGSNPWRGEAVDMRASLKGNQGSMDIYGSVECHDALHLTLTLK